MSICQIAQRKGKHMELSLRNIQKLIFTALAVTALALLPFASRAAGPASAGERVYKSRCSICHAADGSGNTAMGKKLKVRDLRSREVQRESDAGLTNIITNGKTDGSKMQGYKDRLTPEQIQQLVAYVRELGKKK
jgi:mono/diheme cytochrome c family protein